MSEAVILETADKATIPLGREGPTKKSETRSLRLTVDKPIELILGNGHAFNLRRGDDGVVKLSMDGFQLPDPEKTGAFLDEIELAVNTSVNIRRDLTLADDKLNLERLENFDGSIKQRVVDYHFHLPNRAINLHGQKIDFTDIGDRPFSGLSIMVAGRRAGDNMVFITNHDGGFGVAAPEKSLPREGRDVKIRRILYAAG